MTATEIISMLAGLSGGLAFFLYGMSVMSAGLEKMAGGKLERTLKKVTSNYMMSFLLGAGITIAIQSSSAMTVMLVGLVNSGIMEFGQTIGVIMGSNVGTTLTSWLLSLNGISDGGSVLITLLQPIIFAPILALVGIAVRMFSKNERRCDIGLILVGFAVLIIGMDMMSSSVGAVKDMEGFNDMLTVFKNPIVAVLVSTVFTGIIQSSAATVGIVQALALTGSITYEMAIPLVLGANIGTCMTALLSAIGANKNAKRVVAIHIYIKVIGTVICLIALGIVNALFPGFTENTISMFGVALVHTIFNVANTVVLFPFNNFIIRLAEKTIKGDESLKTVFLDERLMNTPPMAIAECKRLVKEMAEMSRESINLSLQLVNQYDESKARTIEKNEETVDRYEDKLGTYLVKLSSNELSEHDSHEVGRLLHTIGDFERISDHAINIKNTALEIKNKDLKFSEQAREELETISDAVIEILDLTVQSFSDDDVISASRVEPLEQVIDMLKDELKERHIARLQEGKCTIVLGFVFNDLLTNYERVSDHCSNIAVATIQRDAAKQDVHKYLKKIKSGSDEFEEEYKIYEKKYSLN